MQGEQLLLQPRPGGWGRKHGHRHQLAPGDTSDPGKGGHRVKRPLPALGWPRPTDLPQDTGGQSKVGGGQ